MPHSLDPPAAIALTAAERRRSLVAVIASVSAIGMTIGLVMPVLAFNLEARGTPSFLVGLMAAMPPIAILVCGPFLPAVVRRLGALPSLYLGTAVSLAALLLFPVFTSLPAWFALRFVMGMGIALGWVVSEVWINAVATDSNRGLVIGIYGATLAGGLGTGPLVVALVGTEGALPFLVGGAMLGASALPLLLATGIAPLLRDPAQASLLHAIRRAPSAMTAALVNGATFSTQFSLLPIYGLHSGLTEQGSGALLTALMVGNIGLQILLGRLVDRWGPHRLLMLCGAATAIGAVALPFVMHSTALAWALLFVWGGLTGGVYTVGLTLVGRRFTRTELAGASTAFVMFFEIGSLAAPPLAGAAMDLWDPHGMLLLVGLPGLALAVIAAIRARGTGTRH
jgi:MFS family permease